MASSVSFSTQLGAHFNEVREPVMHYEREEHPNQVETYWNQFYDPHAIWIRPQFCNYTEITY